MKAAVTTVLTMLLVLASLGAQAQLISAPQTCVPINPAQAQEFEWRENGVFNRSASVELWIVCPLLRSVNDTSFSAEILIRSEVTEFREVACIYREIDLSSRFLYEETQKAVLESGGWQRLLYAERDVINPESNFSITCKLAPETGIGALWQQVSGS
jgi:hypothetical protein